ncbi:uncharacterized protein LOC117497457 [Trematomus bernacchii]|uniref:uncharacterized protein LOC117497457 n=1 Tax=Trematomus bernacchii TaxID=40690 RepID=UPI00146DF457|nr:uncharacterized protein LOC117497457 [Trematomus bernacchii]
MAEETQHTWTEAQTRALVKHRTENEHLFTGKRYTAKKAWGEVLQKMGLEELLTPTQLSNKWDNLKRQYKELKTLPTGTGTEEGEATAATWSWFPLMHEAIGSRPSMEPLVLMDSCVRENEPTADVAPSGIGSSSSGAGATPCGQAIEEEEDPGQPGTSSSTTTLDEEPSTSLSPPPAKKNRASRGALIEFLKEEAKREQERFEATHANNTRLPSCPQVLQIIMVLKFNWVHTWSREQPCQSVSLAMSTSKARDTTLILSRASSDWRPSL